ncbi:potassium channel subunit [Planococcus antarcticus DSM 14505]|uniref:Potassium channel subunit n=1 Tax=Planococcus antarcticus DSM 14505 TaxID=1185653 RepID=A0AA87ILU1_9BACL|nr:potassium channel family protein [Planococcus antarcticus]EIM07205.1 potassium channel subunit [Planococcus antarcticus DSM 14505]
MKKTVIIFEIFMFVLVLISLFFAFSENENFIKLDRGIWFVFVLDYTIRLIKSENKWTYIKQHPFELIAIVPFDSIFRAARIVRLFRVIRLIGIGSRYLTPVYKLLRTNGLDKVLIVAMVLLFLIPIPIVLLEPSINTFGDALWWAVVTTTTVGYGDISPETPIGRVLAVVLMLVGIGIIGTLTSAITSFFSNKNDLNHDKKILGVIQSIEEIENLTKEDIEFVQMYLKRKEIK